MNQYPIWKYLLIITVLIVGTLYALPNLYGTDPSIQVTPGRNADLTQSTIDSVSEALTAAGVESKSMEENARGFMLRFNDTETQSSAQEIIQTTLGDNYTSALNLEPATPEWLKDFGAEPMNLGLDLRGGVHILMEVDMASVTKDKEESFVSELRTKLRESDIRYKTISRKPEGGILLRCKDETIQTAANDLIRDEFPDLERVISEKDDLFLIDMAQSENSLRETKRYAVQQNITTLRNRVNELGVAEPVIQQQGLERIIIQLPGVQDPSKIKEILSATATLEFRMVDEEGNVEEALRGKVPIRSKLYKSRDGRDFLLDKQVMLRGDCIVNASSGLEQQTGSPAVFLTLDGKCVTPFSRATRKEIGHLQAVVFIESKRETYEENGELKKRSRKVEEIINVATIRDELGKRFQISGLDSTEEARDLALLLRAGALVAPIEIIEERTIGPSLGKDNIDKGFMSVKIGFILVLIFMALYYKVFGLVANVALAVNLVLIVALLSLLQATLTLPGIAGIVLTVGMAVDANVLIFERIREELRNGSSSQTSIEAGYAKAFSTIIDANITTLIAAAVLYGFGTGPIKGFAVTLALGILTSMFTAIIGSRALVNLIYGGKKDVKLAI
ncbi:MAG: protein translocase subunit SecD [Gammaproteobacteria bacterium]